MIHFNYDKGQQTFGDSIDPRLEQIIKHHPNFPIAFWSLCDRNQGVDAFAIGLGSTTETVGLHNTTIDTLAIDNVRSYLHIYDDAYVNSIKMTAGILHIMKGGYAGFLDVCGQSEVHITGHIGTLVIENQAQVFLYKGAYVDSLCTYGNDSMLRIYRGASVYRLNIQNHAKVMVEGKYCVNKCINGKEDIIPFIAPREKPALLKVRVTFPDHDELVRFCQEVTESVNNDGKLHINDDIWMTMINDCIAYDSYTKEQACVDTVEFCADAFNDNETTVILAVRKWLIDNYKGVKNNITIWYKGQHELDVIKTPVEEAQCGADAELKDAMEKATPEQWARLLKAVFGDDTKAEGAPHRTHEDEEDRLDTLDDPREL